MFDSFRDKLYSVVQDGINLNNTVRRKIIEVQQSKANPKSPVLEEKINYDAGAFLLEKYQKEWNTIHESSEQNAKAAEEIDVVMLEIQRKVKRQLDATVGMNAALAEVPRVSRAVADCVGQVRALGAQLRLVEAQVAELEALADRTDFQKRKTEHLFQLTMYKEKKLAELEKSRWGLAGRQAEATREAERQQRAVLLQRQRAADAAFQGDLATYKSSGTLPIKPVLPPPVPTQTRLEEIQLDIEDTDTAELDSFLILRRFGPVLGPSPKDLLKIVPARGPKRRRTENFNQLNSRNQII